MQRAEPPPPPQRLKVLLVVTDEVTQRRIMNQLSHSYYRITTCPTFNLALDFFAKEKFDVDLVLSDVSLKVEDGYKFIVQIQRLRKNIPHVVIFEAERLGHHKITTAYKLGACYILRKPLSENSDEIKNLWQHVFRWRAQNEGSSSLVSSQQESLKRGYEFMNHGEEPSLRKQRIVWDEELDALFVKVVNDLGKDAVPKRILEVMNEHRPLPFLTREQVGSHLQKHREKEKKKELHQRRMNNANGRNAMTVNQIPPRFDIKNHILAPPLVSSSSHHDMSHLHLLETSTTDSPLPPPPLPQMQRHHYNQQHIVCQRQIQHEHHEQHLACQPMQFNNFGAVTSLIGNNNLTSVHQPNFHVNTTRPAMHQPDRITSSKSNMPQQRQPQGPSFEGKESNMLQQQHIAPNPTSGMQQLDQNPCSSSRIINQNQALGTSFRRSNMQQQPKTQNLTSGMQKLDQNASSVSGIINQDQALGTPFGRSNMEQLDQNRSLGTSFEKSNMEQQPITHLTSGTQQLDQNSGTQQLDQNPSSVSGIINQDQALGTPFGRSNMDQLDQNHSLGTSFEKSNMEQQPITQNLTSGTQQLDQNPGTQQLDQNPSSGSGIINQNHALGTSFERINMEQQPITQNLTSSTQQLDQTSYALYAPIRSGHDGMITPEATHVDEFGAGLFNQQFEVGLDVQSSDVLDIFPIHGGFLDDLQEMDDYPEMDAYQDIDAPFQEMNEMEPSQLPNK